MIERSESVGVRFAAVGAGRPLIVLPGLSPMVCVDSDRLVWGAVAPVRRDRSPDDLFELGLDRAAVHTDVVLGGPDLSVIGRQRDGTTVDIIRDDTWVLFV